MGDRVVSAIRAHGVDVSDVVRVAGRSELMFVEAGLGTNRTNVVYDRAGAAVENLSIDDINLEVIGACRWLHFTGITPALSKACFDTLGKVIRGAGEAGAKMSCDVNYRSKLWGAGGAGKTISALLPAIDLLLIGRGDLQILWGRNGEAEAEVKQLQQEFAIEKVVLTQGADGAAAIFSDRFDEHDAFGGEVVSPIGAGDAFAAGVLYSLLEDEQELALKRGCAMASLARESRSDYVVGGRDALEAKINEGGGKQLSR